LDFQFWQLPDSGNFGNSPCLCGADKIYCVYIAPNEKMVREHASHGGFPANKVSEIKSTIDPTTAE
jgi:cell division inhibitor SulA